MPVQGVEPQSGAYETLALPLCYTGHMNILYTVMLNLAGILMIKNVL